MTSMTQSTQSNTKIPTVRTAQLRRFWDSSQRQLSRLTGVILFVLLWEIGARALDSLFIPPFSEVSAHFLDLLVRGELWIVLIPSLSRLVPAFLISIVVGIVLGIIIGLSKAAEQTLYPVIQFIRAIPGVAKIPIFLVLLGFTDVMQMWVVALVVVPPIIMNTFEGVRNVNPVLNDTCAVFKISTRKKLLEVVLPSAGPSIFAGIRIAGVIALIVTVVVEMLVGQDGLGNFVLDSERNFIFLDMWSGILLIAVLGWLINLAISIAEHYLVAWHRGYRQATP